MIIFLNIIIGVSFLNLFSFTPFEPPFERIIITSYEIFKDVKIENNICVSFI